MVSGLMLPFWASCLPLKGESNIMGLEIFLSSSNDQKNWQRLFECCHLFSNHQNGCNLSSSGSGLVENFVMCDLHKSLLYADPTHSNKPKQL